MHQDIPISALNLRADARAVDMGAVAALADSIAKIGLLSPIRVRALDSERWEVIAGAHRLAACESLGLVDIPCEVVTDDDLHAELAMIDENLCRAELSPSDRARLTARRKELYLKQHPETAKEAFKGNQHVAVANFATADDKAERFTANTAAATGQSERLVQLNAERGEKVIPEVLDMIRGTKLDTGTYLDRLKKLPPNDQVRAAKRDLALLRAREREGDAGAKRSNLDADIRHRAALACAELLMERLHLEDHDHFRSNASLISMKDLLTEFANLVGSSVMDRGAA